MYRQPLSHICIKQRERKKRDSRAIEQSIKKFCDIKDTLM